MDCIVGSSSMPMAPGSDVSGDRSEHSLRADLESLKAESLGWLPLEVGAYLHISDESAAEVVITGAPQAGPAVLLLV
jgi:hypothetical protein